jgi:hypothetical protein
MKQTDIDTMMEMLTYMRPSGSTTESLFIEKFLTPLGVKPDEHKNQVLVIGSDPTVLWSSHTDTVHYAEGIQKIVRKNMTVGLPKSTASTCLGADCTAGVWIMMEMIKAKVPGMYIFHYGEEVGCIGSSALADESADRLKGIKSAIAFDRRGTTSIITHQRDRTCSDAFGKSLAKQLPKRFKLDDKGILTDTKQYRWIVPECTNLSVGFSNEHSAYERIDLGHLFELRDFMLRINPAKFVIERDPTEKPKQLGLFGRKLHVDPESCSSFKDLVWEFL